MIEAKRSSHTKPQRRPKSVTLENRLARMEQLIYEQERTNRPEHRAIRTAGFIALLLTISEVLIGKLADLILFVIHLATVVWDTVPK